MRPVIGRLAVEYARELFAYDPDTGIVIRKVSIGGQRAGTAVGTLRKDGYLSVKVDGCEVLLHRLVWLIWYGEEPPLEIDHENGDRTNCCILNLRPSDRSGNNQNRRKAHKNNALGILGVRQLGPGRFLARIRVDKKLIRLGVHPTADLASQAYIYAKRKLHKGNTL